MANHKYLKTEVKDDIYTQFYQLYDNQKNAYAIVRLELFPAFCLLHIRFNILTKTNLKNSFYDSAVFVYPTLEDWEYDEIVFYTNNNKLVKLMTQNKAIRANKTIDNVQVWVLRKEDIPCQTAVL